MLDTGSLVSGYRVERMLGSGGMGTVYLAVQLSLNRPVALKMLASELSRDVAFRARFAREGEVQAALDHPHIVPIYEAGDSDSGLFLAMRYVRGSTLKDLILGGALDPERAIRLLTPVADALDAAHAAGLIHRDVKPQNILVDSTEWPYLADFGLTRAGGSSGITRTGQLVGTFDYIAPEQVQGLSASPRSDQYAMAAVLFECLTGEVPYPRDSDAALLYAQVHESPPSLSARRGDVPPAFDAVIQCGMAKDPAERFVSVRALMAAAQDALRASDVPAQFLREIASPPQLTPPHKSATVVPPTAAQRLSRRRSPRSRRCPRPRRAARRRSPRRHRSPRRRPRRLAAARPYWRQSAIPPRRQPRPRGGSGWAACSSPSWRSRSRRSPSESDPRSGTTGPARARSPPERPS